MQVPVNPVTPVRQKGLISLALVWSEWPKAKYGEKAVILTLCVAIATETTSPTTRGADSEQTSISRALDSKAPA